mgnify:CR=1 FL=1
MEGSQERTLPVRAGDWVGSVLDPSVTAKVRAAYFSSDGKVLVDLVVYAKDGTRIGRESPSMGGPRGYESACSWEDWKRIRKPSFPIDLKWIPNGRGSMTAGYAPHDFLPDRQLIQAAAPARPAPRRVSDYDPKSEAAARRLAAQELRDVARRHGIEDLRARADELEAEAEAISPRGM